MSADDGFPLRAAVIGLGRIGWSLERDRLRYHPCTHVGSLLHFARRQPRCDLVAVCDTDPGQLELFQDWLAKAAPRTKPPRAFDDHRSLFRATVPDLVVVSTSLESHRAVALAAIRAGVPRLLLEKPPAATSAAAAAILKASRAAGTRVWVNFERRYHPAYIFARGAIHEQRFGPLRAIRGRVLTGEPSGSGAGPLLHDAVHWLDLLLWFVGPPERLAVRQMQLRSRRTGQRHAGQKRAGNMAAGQKAAAGTAGNGLPEHTTFARFDYPEFSATLECGGRRKYFEFQMELDFAEGRLLVGNEGLQVLAARPSRHYERFSDLRAAKAGVRRENPWLNLYREVLAPHALTSTSTRTSTTANLADALEGMRLVDTIRAAAQIDAPRFNSRASAKRGR